MQKRTLKGLPCHFCQCPDTKGPPSISLATTNGWPMRHSELDLPQKRSIGPMVISP
jgi:hypothetical protein